MTRSGLARGPVRKVFREGAGGDAPTLWDHAWHGIDIEYEMNRYARGRDAVVRDLTNSTPRDGLVLEAGCGSGRIVAWLRSQGVECIGIDFAPGALAEAKARARALPLIAGDVSNMPFPDASLDTVISLGVVEHFEGGPASVLREHFRVLRPGGLLFITVPRMNLVKRLADRPLARRPAYRSWRRQIVTRVDTPLLGTAARGRSFYQYEFPDRWILAALEEAGFFVERSTPAALLFGLRELRPTRRIIERLEPSRKQGNTDPAGSPPLKPVAPSRLVRIVGAEDARSPVERAFLGPFLQLGGHVLMAIATRPRHG